jgi:hypothetical protein
LRSTGGLALEQRLARAAAVVAQICILRSVGTADTLVRVQSPADYKSAIQQITNLRYEGNQGVAGNGTFALMPLVKGIF